MQVSIIVPIYNVEKYLKECLESLINQSYKNLDLILVDDGSTDESLNIALEYAQKDERIFVISKKNYGQAAARNLGLECIKGTALRKFFENKASLKSTKQSHSFKPDYELLAQEKLAKHFYMRAKNFVQSDLSSVCSFINTALPDEVLIHFVDSDDYLRLDCIELCLKTLLENKAELVAHNLLEYDENTQKTFLPKKLPCLAKMQKNSYESGLKLLNENKIYDFYFAPFGLFKADILNRYALRFSEGIYHEDHDFGTLLFALTKQIVYTNEPLYIYRTRINSTMNAQKNLTFPQKLPPFLEPLKAYFKDYKSLRAYFKAYCFVKIAGVIWNFYKQKASLDEAFAKDFKCFFTKSTLAYMKIFKISLKNDPLNITTLLKDFQFNSSELLFFFVKDLHRQVKKLFYITNLKFLLKAKK